MNHLNPTDGIVHFIADDMAPACDVRFAQLPFSGSGNETDVTCDDCKKQLAHEHRGPVKRGPEFARQSVSS